MWVFVYVTTRSLIQVTSKLSGGYRNTAICWGTYPDCDVLKDSDKASNTVVEQVWRRSHLPRLTKNRQQMQHLGILFFNIRIKSLRKIIDWLNREIVPIHIYSRKYYWGIERKSSTVVGMSFMFALYIGALRRKNISKRRQINTSWKHLKINTFYPHADTSGVQGYKLFKLFYWIFKLLAKPFVFYPIRKMYRFGLSRNFWSD